MLDIKTREKQLLVKREWDAHPEWAEQRINNREIARQARVGKETVRRARQTYGLGAQETGRRMRSIGKSLDAFRTEVEQHMGQNGSLPVLAHMGRPERRAAMSHALESSVGAWWESVEEREWQAVDENVAWAHAFFSALYGLLGEKKDWHKTNRLPPMVRKLRLAGEVPPPAHVQAFLAYHMKRPDVYERFKQIARQKRDAGETRLSARALLEELRGPMFEHSGTVFGRQYTEKLVKEDPTFQSVFKSARSVS